MRDHDREIDDFKTVYNVLRYPSFVEIYIINIVLVHQDHECTTAQIKTTEQE